MTLNQLKSLTEDELAMCLYVVNLVDPLKLPAINMAPRHLTWFKHEFLIKKLVNAYPNVLPEGQATYISLLNKLGYHEIKLVKTDVPEQLTFSFVNEQT
jgi:hypothetical protein